MQQETLARILEGEWGGTRAWASMVATRVQLCSFGRGLVVFWVGLWGREMVLYDVGVV